MKLKAKIINEFVSILYNEDVVLVKNKKWADEYLSLKRDTFSIIHSEISKKSKQTGKAAERAKELRVKVPRKLKTFYL